MTIYLTEHAPKTMSPDWLGHMATPINEWWADKRLSDVQLKNCEGYVDWRCAQGVSGQTARHELKTLRTAINFYHRAHGPLPAVPAVSLPPKAEAREDYFLTRKQVAARLLAARRRKRSRHICRVIIIGFYSGTRPGATRKLGWHENPHGGWADLENGILYRKARGAKTTKKTQPKAKIHYRLMAHMKRWKRLDQAKGFNLIVHYYGKPIAKLRNSWPSVAIAAGHAIKDAKGKWIVSDGPHIMRHTAATWLMQSGVDPVAVAGFIGMSLATLLQVYGHHHPDYQSEAASAQPKRTSRSGQDRTISRPASYR